MKWHYYILIGLYCGLIFWISSQSDPPGSSVRFDGADKVAHFGVFGGLAVLVSIGLHRAPRPHRVWVLRYAPVIFALAYGVLDEVHQLFTPGRSFSPADMLADGLGAFVGQLVCWYWFHRRPNPLASDGPGTS